jgi:[ribosomal protein S5]-alanine N-acetyltransferase
MRNLLQEKIETERLVLEPVSLKYANEMLEELTEEIVRFLSFYKPKSVNEEIDFINDSIKGMKNGKKLMLVVLDKATREYLGNTGIENIDTKTPEIGIWIKKSAHGRKIGREAVLGVKKWADTNLVFDYIIYPFHKDNIASRKIAEALGGIYASSGIRSFPSGKQFLADIYHVAKS